MGRDVEANEAARASTEQKLRDAALELLAEHGVAGMSMAALAERAGVSKGLAYHYFPHKRALVQAVVRSRVADLGAIAATVPEGLAPAERLAAFAHAVVEGHEADPGRFRLYLRALTDPALREAVGELPEVDRGGFVQLFRALGAPEPELEARFFQVGLLGILTRAATSPVHVPAGPLVDRLVRAVTQESP